MDDKKRYTNAVGAPIDNDQASITASTEAGPTFIQDVHLQEKLAHFNRERIPERVVHAKGTGAYGTFEVTNDLTQYTCAKFLSEVGKKTDMLARFSTVGGEKGSADSARDPRGFALKFYTEDGNYDLVGNNIPIFFIRDAIKFPDFIHTQKRNPQTNLKDPNMFWDFFSLTPESIHQVSFLFSDRGTPLNYRHMDGFSSHTYMWYNSAGEHFWVKYHFKTDQGNETFTGPEAEMIAGTNPDHATEDLFEAIEKGDFPSWTVSVQIMTPEQAKEYRFNPFDITKVWYHGDYPLIELGKMTLNRNPQNFFTEVEQAAFAPSHFVPGIAASPDKMLQGRLFAYSDAQRYRLGANHEQLPPNRPKHAHANTYLRDGFMQFDGGGAGPNYAPNSVDDVATDPAVAPPALEVEAVLARHEMPLEDIDFEQPGEFWRRVLTDEAKMNLVSNIVGHIKNAHEQLQYRQTALFYKVDPGYGQAVGDGLGLDMDRVRELAMMSQEDRVNATKWA